MDELQTLLYETRYSQLPSEFPDLNIYPKFKNTKKFEITIGPNEKVFIPAGWFHWVFSEDGLNVAIGVKTPVTTWKQGDPDPPPPHKEPHTLDWNLEKLMRFPAQMAYTISENGEFPSNYVANRYTEHAFSVKKITFKKFYDSKLKNLYIMQGALSPIQSLWASWGGVSTTLHYDLGDTWLHQIYGKKRIIFFPPSDYENVYVFNTINPKCISMMKDSVYMSIRKNHLNEFINENTAFRLVLVTYYTDVLRIEAPNEKFAITIVNPDEPGYNPSESITIIMLTEDGEVQIGSNFKSKFSKDTILSFPSCIMFRWQCSVPVKVYYEIK